MKSLLLSILAVLIAQPLVAQEQRVSLELKDRKVRIRIADKPFAVYHLNTGANQPKPYLLPVQAADGTVLTRALKNPEDHPHHKGVWVSVDKVNGTDFWAEKGKIVTNAVDISVKNSVPTLRVTNYWQSKEGKPLVREDTWMTFYPNRLVTYDIRFLAEFEEVTFGDTKEGLFGYRMVNSLREKETGKVINAEGKRGTKACWGQPSAWVDYSGKINDKVYGVAIFDYPRNFRRSRYHVRDYGLFSISPFGEKAYTKGNIPAKAVKLPKGQELMLHYAIYFHDGDTQAGQVAKTYEQFLKIAAAKKNAAKKPADQPADKE